jgi:hypothetical protein
MQKKKNKKEEEQLKITLPFLLI